MTSEATLEQKYQVRKFGTSTDGTTLWSVWDSWDDSWCWIRIGDVKHGSTPDKEVAATAAAELNADYDTARVAL
ncbi:MAG TPA: hypothetical protein VGS97_19915 [Actinocrinis sp.]|uniref:hypothetical protein n=1 Tax=Actinocrinis sp. TaxID=1920516 RepID=UPI002DDD2128|nr:hypothetical protein [Actinocrinis sp.]HEV2346376.1 hypothetical protein [Actinocrinis sp.]